MSLLDFIDISEELSQMAAKVITGDKAVDSILSPYTIDQKKSAKSMELTVRAPDKDRPKIRQTVEKGLKASKVKFLEIVKGGGSVGGTQILLPGMTVKVLYKKEVGSGGMSETTLNSTITELCPAVAFMSGYRYGSSKTKKGIDTVEKLMDVVKANVSSAPVYIGADLQSGVDFVKMMPSSSKFKEKMEGALGVLKYLTEQDNNDNIVRLYWGYRNKPNGVPRNHKGDLFVIYASGGMVGVSIKAGAEKAAEPQLNIYVRKLFRDFGREEDLQKLEDNVYNNIHSKLGLPRDWQSSKNSTSAIKTIQQYSKKYPTDYEELYDKMLEMIRKEVVRCFNVSLDDSKNFIRTHVLDEDTKVPLVVIKGYNKNYSFITDEDSLGAVLPKVNSIQADTSTSSKQNWTINLKHGKRGALSVTMNMSIRSNKSFPENKVAQGVDLAIKFNGLKK